MRIIYALMVVALLGISQQASAASQMLCGWLDNPTPQNFWLTDAKHEWEISIQGGRSAEGLENLPDFGDQWQHTNGGSYGYGCACLKVDIRTDKKSDTYEITRIHRAKALPIKRCDQDKSLPKRTHEPLESIEEE